MSSRTLKAILWDFGGVITTSPFEAFNTYEKAQGIPTDFIRNTNAANPDTNAWARFESSQIDLDEFDVAFEQETSIAGHPVKGRTVIGLLSGNVRPNMVRALEICRTHFKVGCLTNNVRAGKGAGMAQHETRAQAAAKAMALFHVVLESSKEGLRKPNPLFYQRALDALGVTAEETLFLDDLGVNLKPARSLGMRTIKVLSETQALEDLSTETGLALQA